MSDIDLLKRIYAEHRETLERLSAHGYDLTTAKMQRGAVLLTFRHKDDEEDNDEAFENELTIWLDQLDATAARKKPTQETLPL